jgi:alcohol dehydrogenase class IV
MQFEFSTSGRIRFGPGTISELPAAARTFGRRAFVVLGRDKTRHAACIDALESAGSNCSLFSVAGEPSVAIAREGAALARGADVVIGIGGGSVLDTAKAIAALAANPGDVLDYLEVVGRGEPLVNDPLPCIAVPTTSGTGSEVTRNAVLAADGVKASLRHVGMLPKVAIVDPDLAVGLPAPITASTGLDAITQLIEPYVSRRANPMTDAIALEGLRLAVRALPRAYRDPRDREARAGMACAATMSGMALANAGLGVVHGFAAPIGGAFPAPHGAVCAALLSHGMRANIQAAESTVLQRYAVVARILTGDADATPDDGVPAVSRMVGEMAIPGLAAYGVHDRDLDGLCERAARASSMKANPVDLSLAQLREVLERAL